MNSESTPTLREQLIAHTEAGRWSDVVEVLEQLIEQQPDPTKRSKYCYTIGVVQRDEIGDETAAVNAFDAALDADVNEMRAFEAIDRILTEQRDWRELERAYRRMLRRAVESEGVPADIKVLLWRNLGDIYETRLGHPASAIAAYEAALELRPDDPALREILAELRRHLE